MASQEKAVFPPEILDCICLHSAEFHVVNELGSPFLQRKMMSCQNTSNSYHTCTPGCKVVAFQLLRNGETSFADVAKYFKAVASKA
ncbi:hypothetical protein HDU90_002933 [Geranomyces variabilis]|nr:hypothetical protein HDU90_002933 [Geranomyces variabilis]